VVTLDLEMPRAWMVWKRLRCLMSNAPLPVVMRQGTHSKEGRLTATFNALAWALSLRCQTQGSLSGQLDTIADGCD